MIRPLVFASLTTVMLAGTRPATALDVYTDPVGFVTLNIAGTGGSAPKKYSILGLSMTQLVAAPGKITGVSGAVITDSSATWTNNQFNGPGNAHFIEITSGPNAGLMEDIVATDGMARSVTTATDLSALIAAGQTYRIRKHWTIGAVFGPKNEAGLQGAASAANADEVLIFNPLTQTYTTYFYQTNAVIGGTGWRSTANIFTEQADTVLYIDQGIVIARKQSADLPLKLTGSVKLGATIIPIGQTNNIPGNVYAASLVLSNAALYTGNHATGLVGGPAASVADTVGVWNGSGFTTYYFQTNAAVGGTGWRSTADLFTDAGGTRLPAGAGIVILRRAPRVPFNWTPPAPYPP